MYKSEIYAILQYTHFEGGSPRVILPLEMIIQNLPVNKHKAYFSNAEHPIVHIWSAESPTGILIKTLERSTGRQSPPAGTRRFT